MATIAAPPEGPRTKVEDKNFFHLTLVIVFGIFATTLPQPLMLGQLPFSYLLKDKLHCSPDQIAFFFLACGLAWYLKPLAGILTDAFPLLGTKRKHYMIFSALLSCVSWIGLVAIYFLHPTYYAILIGAIVVNLFMVMASTATGAFLVEAGQSYGATGKLTSVRSFVTSVCQVLTGYAGGLLAAIAFFWAAGINAILVLSLVPVTYLYLKERRVQVSRSESLQAAGGQVKAVLQSRNLWIGLGFISLFYFAPGFATLQFFRQNDVLKFDSKFVGLLMSLGGIFALVAAVAYTYAIRKLPLRTIMFFGILLSGLTTFLYLPQFYSGRLSAAWVESQNGLFFTIAEISLLDLAARCTPVGAEGLGYGLILSFRNLAIYGANFLGARLNKVYPHTFTFERMVMLNGGTTLFVLLLLPFLPVALMQTKDKVVASEPDLELRPVGAEI